MRNYKDGPSITSTSPTLVGVGAPMQLGRSAILRAIECLPHDERVALLTEASRQNSRGTITFGGTQTMSDLELETLRALVPLRVPPVTSNRAVRRAKRGRW